MANRFCGNISCPPSYNILRSCDFSPDDVDGIKRALAEDGVVVVRDVINKEDCDRLVQCYRKWLQNFGPEGPDNTRSIIHKYGVGHLEASWQVRLLVKPVFEAVWGTKKLFSSYDGAGISSPPESYSGYFSDVYNKRPCLHLDQGEAKVGLHAYQGAAYLEQADEDDWCFQVITKTHKYHADFFKTFPRSSRQEFRRLVDAEVKWYIEQGCEHVNIPVPKGGMVLWDSRLVHDGSPPKRDRANPDRWRFAIFVSMTPAIWACEKDIATKIEGYHSLRTSRHWSSSGFELFQRFQPAPAPGQDVEKLGEVATSDAARYLVGELCYDYDDGEPNGPDWTPKWE